MRTKTLLIAAMLLSAITVKAQQVTHNGFDRLQVRYTVGDMQTGNVTIDGIAYSTLSLDGYVHGGAIGAPALPQLNSLIEIPVCKDIAVTVDGVYDTVSIALPVEPLQPGRSKSDTARHALVVDREAYASDTWLGTTAAVEHIGVARDRNIARLVFSPVRVNPVQGKAIVCREAVVTIEYVAADEAATNELYSRYHTPAYSVGGTLNRLPKPKSVSGATPVRMAVVTHSSLRCDKLEEFLTWKRQQGLRVDVYYVDELGIPTASAIASMLAGLYTNATDDDPAPAYLLIIGDIAQVPANSSRLSGGGWYGPSNDHITDLYYTTWTSGDKIPDCYHGRISATSASSLGDILTKTLLYEQYQFDDDSYLARAALIAGVDGGRSGDFGYTHADPAMDYAASLYVNHTQGYDTVTYYKNLTTSAPSGVYVTGSSQASSTAATLRMFYNQGAGWINYSAHGNWNEWSQPSFTVNHVGTMTNNGKPSFMIGNCCLSNKFDKEVCFGEALLRKGYNAGAIGYIGGSNSTYWDEDFYRAVGVRSNISGSMTLAYNAGNMGTYDHLFHTHNETIDQTAATASKIMFMGNMAVQGSSSSSSYKDYYWEIYHLLGDPTLMPWLGKANEPYVQVIEGGTEVYVGTIAGAYVAAVDPDDSMRVVSADFSDATGYATLHLPADHAGLMLSVTVQGHKPYHHTFNSLGIAPTVDTDTEVYPNPATGSCTVTCTGMRKVSVVNSIGQTVRTVATAGSSCLTLDLQGLAPGIYILHIATDNSSVSRKLLIR